jgi:hypothetical protein
MFGLGGYLLGEGIRRIAGPIGWATLVLAVIIGFALWRYYKKNEENLLAKAEREMAAGPLYPDNYDPEKEGRAACDLE